jgi:hypothetical protein
VTDAVTSSVECAYVVCRRTSMPLSSLTSTCARELRLLGDLLLANLLLGKNLLLAHLLLRHAQMSSTWVRALTRRAIRAEWLLLVLLVLLMLLLLRLRSVLLGSRLVLYGCASGWGEVLLLLLLQMIWGRRVLGLTTWWWWVVHLLVCGWRGRRWWVGLAARWGREVLLLCLWRLVYGLSVLTVERRGVLGGIVPYPPFSGGAARNQYPTYPNPTHATYEDRSSRLTVVALLDIPTFFFLSMRFLIRSHE